MKMKPKILSITTSILFINNIILFVVVVMITTNTCYKNNVRDSSGNIQLNTRPNPRKYHYYIASLIVNKGDHIPTNVFKCVTVIISKYWVLTIANCLVCFAEFGDENIRIVSSKSFEWHRGKQHKVKMHLAHQNYSKKESSYNIGLIKVVQPFFKSNKGFAKLPPSNYQYVENSTANSYSWNIGTKPILRPTIQVANVILFSQQYCKSLNKNNQRKVTSSMICAGNYQLKDQVCPFDSGAPLIQDGIVIALMAWGARCDVVPERAVYIRLNSFTKCIEEAINEEKIPRQFLKLS